MAYADCGDFLSRLCGGEDLGIKIKHYSYFLSRLCGGEDDEKYGKPRR